MTQNRKELLKKIPDFAERFQQTNLRVCAEQLLDRYIKYMHSLLIILCNLIFTRNSGFSLLEASNQ